MADFEIPENPEYMETVRKLEEEDPAHADLFNQVTQALLNNDAFLKNLAEQHIGDKGNPHDTKASDIGAVSTAELNSAIGTKVDKASGKGLSTNDELVKFFCNTYKEKF